MLKTATENVVRISVALTHKITSKNKRLDYSLSAIQAFLISTGKNIYTMLIYKIY